MGVHEKLTGAQRVAKRRAAMRAQGLRSIQIWVPDVRNPEVRERIRVEIAAYNEQAHRWADVLDDAEAFAAEILADEPDYDWGDEPKST